MATKSNSNNNNDFRAIRGLDLARQRLQFRLARLIGGFEAKWKVPVDRVRINRETEDDFGSYTKLSSVTPHEGVTSFISDVTVEFSRAELVSPNRVEESESAEEIATEKELEAVEDLPF